MNQREKLLAELGAMPPQAVVEGIGARALAALWPRAGEQRIGREIARTIASYKERSGIATDEDLAADLEEKGIPASRQTINRAAGGIAKLSGDTIPLLRHVGSSLEEAANNKKLEESVLRAMLAKTWHARVDAAGLDWPDLAPLLPPDVIDCLSSQAEADRRASTGRVIRRRSRGPAENGDKLCTRVDADCGGWWKAIGCLEKQVQISEQQLKTPQAFRRWLDLHVESAERLVAHPYGLLICLADWTAARRRGNWSAASGAALLKQLQAGGLKTALATAAVRWKELCVGAAIVALIGFLTFPRPPLELIRDDFSDGWFNGKVWRTTTSRGPTTKVVEEDGVLHLMDRGYLITQGGYQPPYELEFDWQWRRKPEDVDPTYPDSLCVVLRGSGAVSDTPAREAADGVVIRFDAFAGSAEIAAPGAEESWVSTKVPLPMPANEWHHVRIEDDGETLRVYLSGPEIAESVSAAPLLEYDYPDDGKPHRLSIYNRERVGFVSHEAWIDNVLLLKPRPLW